jgi:hypothetical protein
MSSWHGQPLFSTLLKVAAREGVAGLWLQGGSFPSNSLQHPLAGGAAVLCGITTPACVRRRDVAQTCCDADWGVVMSQGTCLNCPHTLLPPSQARTHHLSPPGDQERT